MCFEIVVEMFVCVCVETVPEYVCVCVCVEIAPEVCVLKLYLKCVS